MYQIAIFVLTATFYLSQLKIQHVHGHGRLMDPPARNSMWRFGYPTPMNYDDNQLWCGGAATLVMNDGKCGVCGDNYADPEPREYEAGGKYALGLVVRRYSTGQIIDGEAELTANHRGHFEFRLCPVPDSTKEVTQECLDQTVLQVLDENDNLQDRYIINTNETRNFSVRIQLPRDLTCSHCVLQWTYIAANVWGTCPNGTEAVGCGLQETFVNCADIAILKNDGARPPPAQQVPPKNMVLVRDSISGNLIPLVVRSQACVGSGSYESQPGIDDWCQENCVRYPPNCPEDKCKCVESCEAIGSFKNVSGSDQYCQYKCNRYRATECDKEKCQCYYI